MSDHGLHSGHLEFPRREEYRRRRDEVFAARGMLTLATEHIHGWVGDSVGWPIRPEVVLPGSRYLLVDHVGGCAYQMRTGLNTVGRHAGNDVCFEEPWISRRHCVILVHARGGCELHDTASLNGTFVNGVRVTGPTPLRSGDCIQLCHKPLLFVSEADYRGECDDDADPPTIVT